MTAARSPINQCRHIVAPYLRVLAVLRHAGSVSTPMLGELDAIHHKRNRTFTDHQMSGVFLASLAPAVVALSAIHRRRWRPRKSLHAVYGERRFFAAGVCSYGPDFVDRYRRTAGYVDRFL